MSKVMVTTLGLLLAWASVAPAAPPLAAPYEDGRRLEASATEVPDRPVARSGTITVNVYASSAPNAFGSPSWTGYVTNALAALEGELSSNGNRAVDPTAYERAPAIVAPGEVAVTTFKSWRGVVEPPAPFANEYGNRLHFGVHVFGDGSTKFTLEDLTFALHSDDPGDTLEFVGDFIGYHYSSTRYGIDWVDGIKGNGNDIVYSSGNGTTLVDELVYVGVGNAWWPGGDDPTPGNPAGGKQAAMDDYYAWIAGDGPVNVSCTYSVLTFSGSDSAQVTNAPNTIQIDPTEIPDEETPLIGLGMAPSGFEPDSWQNTNDVGGKVNWHARYLADGDYLTELFPSHAATLTIDDIESISYWTNRPTGTAATEDWSLYIYTRPFVGGDASWYGHRFINNFEAHTALDTWTQYSTATGMTFRRSSGTPTGHVDWTTFKATYGTQLVEMISVQTHSNFADFNGLMDGLIITLTDGTVGRVDFIGPSLRFVADDACYADGSPVSVELWMDGVADAIVGGQFFLAYDSAKLTFVSAEPESPFMELYEVHTLGELDYGINILAPGSTTGSALMAVLTFTAQEDLCADTGLITWRAHDPPTRLSTDEGAAVYPQLMELDVSDTEAPVITCPADVQVECDGPSDPGTTGFATATDNCSVTVDITHSDVVSLAGCGGYTGTITRTWTATDLCGNVDTCVQVITVADTTDPTFEFVPPDATIECDESTVPSGLYGVATGGVAVYYNDNGDGENPANQAFFKAQVDGTNDPLGGVSGVPFVFSNAPLIGGSPFSWHLLYSGLPYPNSQFGLDFVLPAPTFDGSVPVPVLLAYENGNNNIGGRISAGAVTWAIDNYQPHTPNVGAGEVINSLIRSGPANPLVDVEITQMELTETPPIYTMQIAGKLVSDGVHHWYTLGQPDSPMANFGLNGDLYFEGTLTYDSTGDPGTDLIDFYSGTINVYANSPTTQLEFARAIDNCDAVPDVTYSDDLSGLTGCNGTGTILRTWTATDACGNASSVVQTITVQDTTDPVIDDCPADITVLADAGLCGAVVTYAEPGAIDNCGTPDVTCDWPSGSLFPVGTTLVTCTAEDECGNTSSCGFSVTVEGETELVVDVDLDATFTGTRCITFELWDCGEAVPTPEIVSAELSFVSGSASAEVVLVPCGNYTCITARDELHTVRRTAAIVDGGTEYTASFTGADELLGGNLNDDKWIDILDFGIYSWKFATAYGTGNTTCATPTPHADVSGNGTVFTEDFTFIQINFLEGHEPNCCGALLVAGDDGPIVDISIAELKTRGLGHLAPADLNRDGRLNELDIAAFAGGARPRPNQAPIDRVPGPRPAPIEAPAVPVRN